MVQRGLPGWFGLSTPGFDEGDFRDGLETALGDFRDGFIHCSVVKLSRLKGLPGWFRGTSGMV
jgi:hypothetical protein